MRRKKADGPSVDQDELFDRFARLTDREKELFVGRCFSSLPPAREPGHGRALMDEVYSKNQDYIQNHLNEKIRRLTVENRRLRNRRVAGSTPDEDKKMYDAHHPSDGSNRLSIPQITRQFGKTIGEVKAGIARHKKLLARKKFPRIHSA